MGKKTRWSFDHRCSSSCLSEHEPTFIVAFSLPKCWKWTSCTASGLRDTVILAFFLVWSLLVFFLLCVGLCFGCFDFGPFCTAVEFYFDFSPSLLGLSRGCELGVLRSLHNGKKNVDLGQLKGFLFVCDLFVMCGGSSMVSIGSFEFLELFLWICVLWCWWTFCFGVVSVGFCFFECYLWELDFRKLFCHHCH